VKFLFFVWIALLPASCSCSGVVRCVAQKVTLICLKYIYIHIYIFSYAARMCGVTLSEHMRAYVCLASIWWREFIVMDQQKANIILISYSWIRASQYESVEITNKMQPCNIIYHSSVYWSLNMFRVAHRSSSGVLNCICSLLFTYTCGDRPLSSLSEK
jgi:hypothetical protein